VGQHRRALVRDRPVKLVGGVGEQLDAVLDQSGRDCIERDAGFLELRQYAPRVLDIFLKTVTWCAVVAEASSVAGGTVLTVLGPISSST